MEEITLENDLVKEWIGDSNVINSIWLEREANLRVVVKDSVNQYQLLRFFDLRGKTQVSVDVRSTDADYIISKMMDLFIC